MGDIPQKPRNPEVLTRISGRVSKVGLAWDASTALTTRKKSTGASSARRPRVMRACFAARFIRVILATQGDACQARKAELKIGNCKFSIFNLQSTAADPSPRLIPAPH